jgi:hypothetical protein
MKAPHFGAFFYSFDFHENTLIAIPEIKFEQFVSCRGVGMIFALM